MERLYFNLVAPTCLEQNPIKTLGCFKWLKVFGKYEDSLVEVIPQMKSLTYIDLYFQKYSNTLELFSAIARSNITNFSFHCDVKTDVFYESMAALMHSNKLQDLELTISEAIDTKRLCVILFGPSCLRSLRMNLMYIALTENSLASLRSNTSLTIVRIFEHGTRHNHLPMLTKIIVSNKTLQVLEIDSLDDFSREDILWFGWALQSNTTLRKIVLRVHSVYHGKGIFSSIVDSRLSINFT